MEKIFGVISVKLLAAFLLIISLLVGIATLESIKPPESSKFCLTDSDCACGRNAVSGECFYGNRQFVNTSEQCPDFCDGIGGNLEIMCVNAACTQVQKGRGETQPPAECAKDSDCGTGGCSGQVCATAERASSVITTCEYLPEYGCLKKTGCGCVSGRCEWRQTREYLDCLKDITG